MKSFKTYFDEQQRRINPNDRERSKNVGDEKQVDFEDPAYNHGMNKALKDSEKWPPKPEAKYKADQIRWGVSVGKKAQHLSKEQ